VPGNPEPYAVYQTIISLIRIGMQKMIVVKGRKEGGKEGRREGRRKKKKREAEGG
jgi:hypothetical protein